MAENGNAFFDIERFSEVYGQSPRVWPASVFCHTLFRVAVFGKWSTHIKTPVMFPTPLPPTCFFHAGRIHFAFDHFKGQQKTVARKTPCATDLAKGKDAAPRGRGGVKKKKKKRVATFGDTLTIPLGYPAYSAALDARTNENFCFAS